MSGELRGGWRYSGEIRSVKISGQTPMMLRETK